MSRPKIQADFDRLATLEEDWNVNDLYHGFLLSQLPPFCGEALEIGCGTGAFACLLAERFEHLLALDLSPQSIRIAKERSHGYSNIEYRVADVLECELPAERFDYVVSITTLHHLPLETMLTRMKETAKPGGALAVLDIPEPERLSDYIAAAIASPACRILRLFKTGSLVEPVAVRQAWEEHGRTDVYPRLSCVRKACQSILPGAQVRKHLFFRYSIVWNKPIA